MMIHRCSDLQIQQDFFTNVLPFINSQVECIMMVEDGETIGWFLEQRKVIH